MGDARSEIGIDFAGRTYRGDVEGWRILLQIWQISSTFLKFILRSFANIRKQCHLQHLPTCEKSVTWFCRSKNAAKLAFAYKNRCRYNRERANSCHIFMKICRKLPGGGVSSLRRLYTWQGGEVHIFALFNVSLSNFEEISRRRKE